jgi:Ca2+-transporting ATPase
MPPRRGSRGRRRYWHAGRRRALQPLCEESVAQLPLASPDEALARLGSRSGGLDAAEARRALERFGPNLLPEPRGRLTGEMLGAQLCNLPVALLAGSAVLSLATGGVFDAVVTLVVICINTGIGYTTESSTERLIRRLSRPVEHQASVLRDGLAVSLPAREVVPATC